MRLAEEEFDFSDIDVFEVDRSGLSSKEAWALAHSEQHLGCIECKESHTSDSFCACGRCYYRCIKNGTYKHDEYYGTFVHCDCGADIWWD